jgi:hypothetical protein
VYIALALAFVIFVVILSAALVIAVVLVFTIYAVVKMVRLIDSGQPARWRSDLSQPMRCTGS